MIEAILVISCFTCLFSACAMMHAHRARQKIEAMETLGWILGQMQSPFDAEDADFEEAESARRYDA